MQPHPESGELKILNPTKADIETRNSAVGGKADAHSQMQCRSAPAGPEQDTAGSTGTASGATSTGRNAVPSTSRLVFLEVVQDALGLGALDRVQRLAREGFCQLRHCRNLAGKDTQIGESR